jgi:hypothetical protein
VVSCPKEGRLRLDGRTDLAAGTSAAFGIIDGGIVIKAGERVLALLAADDFADLAKCLQDGFAYHGEVEIEDGETFVRFWMG